MSDTFGKGFNNSFLSEKYGISEVSGKMESGFKEAVQDAMVHDVFYSFDNRSLEVSVDWEKICRDISDSKKDDLYGIIEKFRDKKQGLEVVADSYIYNHFFEKEFITSIKNALNDPRTVEAVEETGGKAPTIGIEYEIPTKYNGSLTLEDVGRNLCEWYDDAGGKLFTQETAPVTVELQSSVKDSPKAVALEIDQRLKVLEEFSKASPVFSEDSSSFGTFYPGLHVNIGLERGNDFGLKFQVLQDIPLIGFITANGSGEFYGEDCLSRRQMKNIERKSERHVLYRGERGTMEYRVSDVHRDYEKLFAVTGLFLGLHEYYKDKEITDFFIYRDMEERWKNYLMGCEEPSYSEFENLSEKIGEGLEKSGLNSDNYTTVLKEMFEENLYEVGSLN